MVSNLGGGLGKASGEEAGEGVLIEKQSDQKIPPKKNNTVTEEWH
jgi:hypothetical protein